jgi:hypothetical protein
MVSKTVFFILASLALGQALAVGSVQQQKLVPSDGGSFDRSGWSVSISGDGNTLLVGTPYGDMKGNIDQGSAYIFFASIVPDLTMTEWGIIIFVLLSVLGCFYYLGRKKRTNHGVVHSQEKKI